ncbi:MAG: mannose-1-phosphate guanylyltransferase [Gemmatimonadetes bacterium]|nr:mannose-1-phosphate guanylyltransferase [Gemmatimonadota bacterium]
MSGEPPLWAVVLAGGVGSRFWPVSTPRRPKQLLPLGGVQPLLAETLERIAPLVPLPRLRVLTGAALADPILSAVPELGPENLLLEPQPRGTAPVLAWAAFTIVRREPDAVMASLHADHVITPAAAFRELLAAVARLAAQQHLLFTIGVEPAYPETGYGYIRLGPRLAAGGGAYEVAEFVEKPDRAAAEAYLRGGNHLWNSGIFVWRAATFLQELERHTPEIASLLPLLAREDVAGFFERAPTISVDQAVLERSDRVGVLRATFRWDDVGTWDAVGRVRAADAAGNVPVGDVHLLDAERCIAWAEDGSIVVFGASDLVVVRAHGVTLVAPRERSAELKELLARLPERLRSPEA